jgi:excisionase family DNA binding protein
VVEEAEAMTTTHAPKPPSPVMTIPEVARFLQVHPTTVYRLVRQGKLPAFKIGSEYRFNRETIEQWVELRQQAAMELAKPGPEAKR